MSLTERQQKWFVSAQARVDAAAIALPNVLVGQRKGFIAFSRKVQFAALRPRSTRRSPHF